jgi:glycosyltransferase involved in cell wall biosynthesis
MNVLYVDIEGGWGGSSRSLLHLLNKMDRKRYEPYVLLGKRGPAEKVYQDQKIQAWVFEPIPRTTAIRKGNWRSLLRFIATLVYLPRLLKLLGEWITENHISIIHLNHESLFFLGLCCSLLYRAKIVYHVRTMLPPNLWARMQITLAVSTADHLIFITENEKNLWERMSGKLRSTPHSVIHNIAEILEPDQGKRGVDLKRTPFKIVSLMTISYWRGIDRLVDIGVCLKEMNRRGIVFVICGRVDDPAYDRAMRERIRKQGLEEYFLFAGYQKDPEKVLKECDALIRPSREYNPWGRDVIEAIALGKPVIAIGRYDKFVEDGVNGYLLPEFDAKEIAEKIVFLLEHPEVVEKMGNANREKANKLFDGTRNAGKVAAVYDSVLQS